MSRIRYLKPSFFKDEDIAELPFQTRLLYQGLWCLADKEGRLPDRPKWLKIEIFPYEEKGISIDLMLTSLSCPKANRSVPFINRYEIDGEKYIQILKWHDHQKPHHTEKESIIPPAPPLKDKENGDGELKAAQSECEVKHQLDARYLTVKNHNQCKPDNLGEVVHYFLELGEKGSDAALSFYDHFTSNGWRVGGRAPMKDWKAAGRNWLRSPFRKRNRIESVTKAQERTLLGLKRFQEKMKNEEPDASESNNPISGFISGS